MVTGAARLSVAQAALVEVDVVAVDTVAGHGIRAYVDTEVAVAAAVGREVHAGERELHALEDDLAATDVVPGALSWPISIYYLYTFPICPFQS
mmetsp:Transcript_7625/g.13353  ORF Transcript_7625/g.13353 Transcript_7625/m.13353 type:complete len:93 (+) Transcript_7625:260-538(+)